MRNYFTWPTIFFAAVVVLCCSAAWACGDEPRRPTYLWFFSATNCGPCWQQKDAIASSVELQAAIAKLTTYKLDYDREEHRPAFVQAGANQLPTVVIYDHRKTEMRRLVGFPSVGGRERLLKFLEGR